MVKVVNAGRARSEGRTRGLYTRRKGGEEAFFGALGRGWY